MGDAHEISVAAVIVIKCPFAHFRVVEACTPHTVQVLHSVALAFRVGFAAVMLYDAFARAGQYLDIAEERLAHLFWGVAFAAYEQPVRVPVVARLLGVLLCCTFRDAHKNVAGSHCLCSFFSRFELAHECYYPIPLGLRLTSLGWKCNGLRLLLIALITFDGIEGVPAAADYLG